MIIRHGDVVAEGWWSPYAEERVHLLYSLSKSFTSTAAAFAIAEGLLDLDATVLSYFPEFDSEITDPHSRSMLLRDLAAMASGHLEETVERAFALDPVEPVRGFLLIPPDREPGSVFAHNQPCTYALAAIIQRLTDQTLTAYLRPRLLDPLGIGEVGWQQYPDGRDIGYSGLHATTDAIARLGLLYSVGSGTVSGCCRRSGSPRPPGCRWKRKLRTNQIRTGDRDTGSSSGCPDTGTAATARTGSSAWCFPNRTW